MGRELWRKCNASKQQRDLICGTLVAKMRTSIALCLFVVVAGAFAAPWEKIEETEQRFEREYQYLRKFTQVGVQVDTEVENVVRSVISRRNLTMRFRLRPSMFPPTRSSPLATCKPNWTP